MKVQVTQVLAFLAVAVTAAPSPQIAPAVTQSYVKVGEGSPRQAYLYEQSTRDIGCAEDGTSCGMTSIDIKSSSHGWSISFGGSAGSKYSGFISGGYSVTETKSIGQSATCNTDGGGEWWATCVWSRIAYTGYEVVQMEHRSNQNAEDGKQIDGPFYLWAPNEEDGHGYVCAHNDDCWTKGNTWWGDMSREDTVFTDDTNARGPSRYVWRDVKWQ